MQETIFKDFGKVVIRSPLYSYLNLFDPEGEALNLDDVVLCYIDDPVFIEGLYWSSPQLYKAILQYKKGDFNSAKKEKLKHTLKKYAIRASTRCTPYGLFAGCAIANIDNRHSTKEPITRKVRIDTGLLQQLVKLVETDSALWKSLYYRVNNSIYSVPNEYRFMESVIEDGKHRYQVSSIEQTDLIRKIVGLSHKKTFFSIDEVCLMAEDNNYDEFLDFIKELVDAQFLVSELQLGLTIENELEKVYAALNRLVDQNTTEGKKYCHLFETIINVLKLFEILPAGTLPVTEIKYLELLLSTMGFGAEAQHLFHADLKKQMLPHFIFTKENSVQLKESIYILSKLSSSISPHEVLLANFKKLFYEKYEMQEIPLTEILDPEFGIGFPAMDNIGNTAQSSIIEKVSTVFKPSEKIKPDKCHAWLQYKINSLDTNSLRDGIQLADIDLKNFSPQIDQLANQFSIMGTLLPAGNILLQSVGGAHANMLLGRFAYMDDRIRNLCKELADDEQQINNEIIFAEVVHVPDGRAGNIARRPLFFDFEIPYLSSSSLNGECQILIDDLMVSVQHDEIILRSKKLNKRVVPRLSNAHNFMNSTVPVYKFLAAIQHQRKPGLEINWGDNVFYKRFLPRISYKNIVLHRASWYLQEEDVQEITQNKNALDKLSQFLQKWQVPRFVCLAEGDNELFIDTSNKSYLQVLLEEMKTLAKVRLIEWLHGVTNIEKEKESTIQQFILPLAKIKPSPFRESALKESQAIKRNFEPGSEWIYFKIYCSAGLSDKILLQVLKPAINALVKAGIICRAFFIRYSDPHHHIRFRLQLISHADTEGFAKATKIIYDLLYPFALNRTVWNIQLDTYRREIERYGVGHIIDTEEFFYRDSLLCLTFLEDEAFAEIGQIRFLTALKNIDNLLALSNLSHEEKISFCNEMTNAFKKQFNKQVRVQIDDKYREWKSLIPIYMEGDKYNHVFTRRNTALAGLTLPIENISSYIHMSLNRWFVTEQRLMEYMAYTFCVKYYNQQVHKVNVSQ